MSACLGFSLPAAFGFFAPVDEGGPSLAETTCLANAADCPSVLACVGRDGRACPGDANCDGDVAVHCPALPNGLRSETREPCSADAAGNTGCAVADDQGKGIFAVCNAGPCQGERCEDDVRVSCFDGVEIRTDCAHQGRICLFDAAVASAACVLPEACGADHCEGTLAVSCSANRRVAARVDCSRAVPGGICQDSHGAVQCAAAVWDPACPADQPFTGWCDDTLGVICFAGARVTVDCAAFPGATCQQADGSAAARCRVPSWP